MIIKKLFSKKRLSTNDLSQGLLQAEYAVRGFIPIQAQKIAEEQAQGIKYPFDKLTSCHVGNPQVFGQKPITFNRQVLSGFINSIMIDDMPYNQDVKNKVIYYASQMKNQNNSQGFEFIRQNVANFIEKRDGHKKDSDSIFLINGASNGIHLMFDSIIKSKDTGVMIPIPQYPLYSACISLKHCQQVNYYLDEENDWEVNMEDLEKSYQNSVEKGIQPKIFVLINPGNPTGQVMSLKSLQNIAKFCEKNNLAIMADEVYQENIYNKEKQFLSMRKVVLDLQSDVEVFSFHSTSKGILGECGFRGGYMEMTNVNQDVFEQLLKIKSIYKEANHLGQLTLDMMINPIDQQTCSLETKSLFQKEVNDLKISLKNRADIVYEALNEMKNIHTQKIQGAMYAFPSILLSNKSLEKAKQANLKPDTYYCLEVLKNTGIILVPGSGFNQKENTHHFRITTLILSDEHLKQKMNDLKIFNDKFHSL